MADKKDLKYLVRIMNTDLDGSKNLHHALTSIKGVSFMFSNALCKIAGINTTKKTGHLSETEVKKINEIIKDPLTFGIPTWLINRRKDPETGEDSHILTSNLDFITANDIKILKKTKSYKGTRHIANLPARGQRTKSNFRKTKTKGKGGSLGVARKNKK